MGKDLKPKEQRRRPRYWQFTYIHAKHCFTQRHRKLLTIVSHNCCLQAQKRQSISESPETISHFKIESTETSDSAREQINILSPQVDTTPEKGSDVHLNDNDGTPYENSMIQRINKQQQDLEKDSTASIPSTETPGIGVSETDAGHLEASPILTDKEAVTSTSNGELVNEIASVGREEHPLPLIAKEVVAKEVEVMHENNQVQSVDAGQDNRYKDADVPPNSDQERSPSISTDVPSNRKNQLEVADGNEEPVIERSKQLEPKTGSSPLKVQEQDQLEEVSYLLWGEYSYTSFVLDLNLVTLPFRLLLSSFFS